MQDFTRSFSRLVDTILLPIGAILTILEARIFLKLKVGKLRRLLRFLLFEKNVRRFVHNDMKTGSERVASGCER